MAKRILGLLFLLFVSQQVFAWDFSAVNDDGKTIYFNITSPISPSTVEVSYNDSDSYSETINIPSTVTNSGITYNVTSIGDYAFRECIGLTGITIPNSVTSIGQEAFGECSSLTSITIPNSVTTIGVGAFYGCSNLTGVSIPSSVTDIGDAVFSHCLRLETIAVLNGNTIYDSRNNCNAIIETSSNTLISGCKNTIIPNSVTNIGNQAFDGCSSLSSVIIPNSVTSIGARAFGNCFGLTNITIPNSITSIGNDAFYDCSKLTSITIPSSVTSIGNNAFCKCSGLANIIVDSGNIVYDSRNNCNAIIETLSNTLISGCKNTIIPNSVTSIGNQAFYGCYGLKSVTLPKSITSIDNAAFAHCIGLQSITSLPTTSPQVKTGTFYSVSSSCPVHVPCGSQQSYSSTWSYFSNFVEDFAYSITASGNDTTMGSAAVTTQPTCTDPTAVLTATANQGYQFVQWSDGDSSNPRTVSVTQDTTIVAQFAATSNICASGVCGDSLTWTLYDDGELRISGTGPMYSYTSWQTSPWLQDTSVCKITSVMIEPGVTTIGAYAFRGCKSITSITIPNSVVSIGSDAFSGCISLTNITIPNSVNIIRLSTFYNCSSLTDITIPNSVTSIGDYAFDGCM